MTTISARSMAARSSRLAASNWLTESLRCLTIFSSTVSTAASSSSVRSSTSRCLIAALARRITPRVRSEEHTSELQSLMRISYAVFCLKKKKITNKTIYYNKVNIHDRKLDEY